MVLQQIYCGNSFQVLILDRKATTVKKYLHPVTAAQRHNRIYMRYTADCTALY
jgi:hypothetical protein